MILKTKKHCSAPHFGGLSPHSLLGSTSLIRSILNVYVLRRVIRQQDTVLAVDPMQDSQVEQSRRLTLCRYS